MKKNIFLFLPFTFLFVLLLMVTAFASSPSIAISSKSNGKNQQLTLNDVSDDCYGLEMTLTTDTKNDKQYENDNGNDIYTTYTQNGSDITLYIVSKNTPLNEQKNIVIGNVTSDDSFTIESASSLKLLDKDFNKTQYDTVRISGKSQSSSSGSHSSSSSKKYDVDISNAIKNGSITVSSNSSRKGEIITITVKPQNGYELYSITALDEQDKELKLTEKQNNQYTFVMPSSDIFIKAEFTQTVSQTPPTNNSTNNNTSFENIVLPFTDVNAYDWYYNSVKYVYANNMMAGTDTTIFSPNVTTTRAMIVTILHRLDGNPNATASNFIDVEQNQYYTNAVAWASANGIVSGYGNGNFGPNDTITREQMAAILYRYAQYKGYDTTQKNNLSNYIDAKDINAYAVEALQWANQVGMITGVTDTTLVPNGSATRAQVSSILMRFCQNIVK